MSLLLFPYKYDRFFLLLPVILSYLKMLSNGKEGYYNAHAYAKAKSAEHQPREKLRKGYEPHELKTCPKP